MKEKTLPDILRPNLLVVFCGLNPGMQAARSGHHFAGRNNRFWKTVHLAGFTQERILPENDRFFLNYCCGLTVAVERPTAGADQLLVREFEEHRIALEQKIERFAPKYVAFLGKAAYAAISHQPKPLWGKQDAKFGGANVWVLPNPSGRNRGFSADALVQSYRELYVEMNRG